MALYLLFETASGYSLFEALGVDELSQSSAAVQQAVTDISRFGKVAKLLAFKPFTSAAEGLEQINAISESQLTEELKNFLEVNLPKVKKKEGKKPKYQLGVADAKLGSAIQEETGIPCVCNEFTGEVMRGLRAHLQTFIKGLEAGAGQAASLGLAHSYSRAKVKFNVNRVDNMIIQAIALLDTLDRDINTFVMRVREWYSWHFPELVRLVNDNYQYARLALIVKDKSTLQADQLPAIEDVVGDKEKAEEILEASKHSMGQDISPIDLINIETFARRVISLAEYRLKLHTYLLDRMHTVAPNLSALIGEIVGARLISHAGSLTNLAKYPASTVQILGAEKALFRALKTRGNTPKYGLIFHSSFIGRAKQRNKGRISRYLANKCSIASRIDCFRDIATSAFGEKLKEQVEERLRFYEDGVPPGKNLTAMQEALAKANGVPETDAADQPNGQAEKKKKKKRKTVEDASEPAVEEAVPAAVEEAPRAKTKKAKVAAAIDDAAPKAKKVKKAVAAAPVEDLATGGVATKAKKKKKKAAAE